ncbi:MAG: pyridoxamine 5'-phosphate oxidase family protein [Candidatus Methanomethylicaceae archaeon]|jgi:predicted pyridoxine 5'-phosphate oxidase superfamily flavin-nucleotide-binding protein
MKIPENVKDCLNKSLKERRLVLGTTSKAGVPNAVPIGILKFHDDETLIVIDNYFLKTRENLNKNPLATITCWNMEEKDGKLIPKDGFQLKGKAKIEDSGPLYDKIKAEVKASNANLPAKAIVLVKVEEIYDVKSGPNAGKKVQ